MSSSDRDKIAARLERAVVYGEARGWITPKTFTGQMLLIYKARFRTATFHQDFYNAPTNSVCRSRMEAFSQEIAVMRLKGLI